jgi:hypothetical protein
VHNVRSFELSDRDRDVVRRYLRRKDFDWSEEFFLTVLETPRNRMEVYWAVIGLRACGTERSIPVLRELLHYPMADVKACSILTIAQIAGSAQTQLYADALLDPKYPEKDYALWAIWAVGDGNAVDAVVAYFKKNMSRIRDGRLQSVRYEMGARFLLEQTSGNDAARGLLAALLESRRPEGADEQGLFREVEARIGPSCAR